MLALILAAAIGFPASAPRPRSGAEVLARARALDRQLAAALDSGQVARAASLADSAVRLRERGSLPPLAVAAYLDSIAPRFFALGTAEAWSTTQALFLRSLAIKDQALGSDALDVARTLMALARIGEELGSWDEAAARAERALAIRRRQLGTGDAQVASSMRQLGVLRHYLGQYAAADSLIAGALAIYQGLPGDQSERIVDGLNTLGEIRRVQDDLGGAEACFRRGIDLTRERLPDKVPLRLALINNLAGLYRDQARFADAEPLLQESLALNETLPSAGDAAHATALLNLAEIFRLQGRHDEAAPLYGRALALARPALGAGNPALAPFVNQAAVSFEQMGRLDEAEPLVREALAMSEAALGPNHPLVAQSLHDLGRLLERRGAFAAAESTYRRAAAIRAGRLGAQHPEVAATRVALARCLSQAPGRGDPPALAELEAAIAVLDSTRTDPESRLEAYALRSAIAWRAGRSAAAVADLAVALDALDSLRAQRGGGDATRAAFVARHLDLYDRMVGLRLSSADADAALAAHERGRARVLGDQIAASGVDLRAGLAPADREPLEREEAMARTALARAQRAIDDARAGGEPDEARRRERVAALEAARDSAAWRLQRVGERIRDQSPLWRNLLTAGGRPATRARAQAMLERDEILIEYHVGERASWVFALERGGRPWRAFPLEADPEAARELGIPAGALSGASLARAIAGPGAPADRGPAAPAGVAELLSDASGERLARFEIPNAETPGTLERRLHALWRVLVPEALRARLLRAATATIVPDAELHLLPFDALVVAPRVAGQPTRYWLDDGPAVRYAASTTSLLGLEGRRSARPAGGIEVLSVSDPAFGPTGDGTWKPLPGTRRETEAIRAAFAPRPIDALQGAEATEPAVRRALPGHAVVHFATHGFVAERRSNLLAGLVLAPDASAGEGTEADGLLQLFEIYALDLHCDLAILSACETARGTRVAGEGVFALSRGFHAAGVARVIASLWPVNDVSTAALVGAMFAGAKPGGRPPDWTRRLRDAKRAVRGQVATSEPFYWAPFVLSGVR